MYIRSHKSFSQRLYWGRQQASALQEQHVLRPFTHEAIISFTVDVDVARFRRRISDLNSGRFDIVWFKEVARGEQREHYHLILRTSCSKREFELFVCDCLAQRKGSGNNSLRSQFRLHWDDIDTDGEIGLWLYSAKATAKKLRQNELMIRGCRETFTTGKPFDRTKKALISTPERHTAKILALVASDPDIIAAVVDGRLSPKQLWDRRFHWLYNRGYYRGIGLLGRYSRMVKSGSLSTDISICIPSADDLAVYRYRPNTEGVREVSTLALDIGIPASSDIIGKAISQTPKLHLPTGINDIVMADLSAPFKVSRDASCGNIECDTRYQLRTDVLPIGHSELVVTSLRTLVVEPCNSLCCLESHIRDP